MAAALTTAAADALQSVASSDVAVTVDADALDLDVNGLLPLHRTPPRM